MSWWRKWFKKEQPAPVPVPVETENKELRDQFEAAYALAKAIKARNADTTAKKAIEAQAVLERLVGKENVISLQPCPQTKSWLVKLTLDGYEKMPFQLSGRPLRCPPEYIFANIDANATTRDLDIEGLDNADLWNEFFLEEDDEEISLASRIAYLDEIIEYDRLLISGDGPELEEAIQIAHGLGSTLSVIHGLNGCHMSKTDVRICERTMTMIRYFIAKRRRTNYLMNRGN